MYAVHTNRLTTTELEARQQLYLKHCKNRRNIIHKNDSLDRFSEGQATDKQDVSWFMQYSFHIGFRPCLYEDLRPMMRWGQLQASERFTFENFYSHLDYVKLKPEWI